MDMTTSYLGFRLPHPFIAGASPLGWSLDAIKRLEDAGAAALVLPSLFEEQITMAAEGKIRHMDPLESPFAERLAVFPRADDYPLGPDEYATHVSRVKQAVAIPVIGSLNGTAPESWLKFARIIEQAGADALELNLYEVVTDLAVPASALERQSRQSEACRGSVGIRAGQLHPQTAKLERVSHRGIYLDNSQSIAPTWPRRLPFGTPRLERRQ